MNLKNKLLAFLLCGIIALFFCFYSYTQIHSLTVTRYTVSIKNLPATFEGFTILQLSDLHSKNYGAAQEQLLELINKQNFDMVALTGDFVDKKDPSIEPSINLLKGLTDKPMFFVPGNHDWWTNFALQEPLKSLGVAILQNQAVKYIKDGEHIWILGVDDPYTDRDNLKGSLEQVDDSAAKILLAHAPNIYDEAIRSNIDLVLTGHTHGGQVRLPLVGAIVAPGQGFFPKLDYGLYAKNSTSMVINGGIGESALPIRFNSRPEIVLITLKKYANPS